MLKKAKYWRAFTAATRTQAEQAAAAWWAEQSGLDRISGWTLPAGDAPAGAAPQWTTTIVYAPSDIGPRPATVH
jgi:hypothetical protein